MRFGTTLSSPLHLLHACNSGARSWCTRFNRTPSFTWSSTCVQAARCNASARAAARSTSRPRRYDYYSRQPNSRLDEVQARFIIAECVLALEYIHRFETNGSVRHCPSTLYCSKGYVHRDIKPENVLFTSDGHCKMVCCTCCNLWLHRKIPPPVPTHAHFTVAGSRSSRPTLDFRRLMQIAL